MRATSRVADGKALRAIGFGFGSLTLAVTLVAAFLTTVSAN
jgi:hypothetical protein